MSARFFVHCLALVLLLLPASARAQNAAAPSDSSPSAPSNLWVVFGGVSTTVRGTCQFCEGDFTYHHTGGVFANVGRRVSSRVDIGGEVMWVAFNNNSGDYVRTTFLNAVAEFRPWTSAGFVVRGGAGMALVRSWVFNLDQAALQKALSVQIGAGWVFRPQKRIGVELLAMQHAAALGDFTTSLGEVENVMGNYWSVGAAVVIR
jgi:hypothetical protein